MEETTSREELEKKLEGIVVCDVFNEIHRTAQYWNKGGALLHRVRAMGYLAEAGARNIRDGRIRPINGESTFKDMQKINEKIYNETINFIYSLVQSRIYVP